MEFLKENWFVLVICAGAIGVTIWAALSVLARQKEMIKLAQELGWRFGGAQDELRECYLDLRHSDLGITRVIDNDMYGERDGNKLWLAEFRFSLSGGKHKNWQDQTICIMQSPRLALPHFFLHNRPDRSEQLGEMLGDGHLTFDDDPEFSDSFFLQGADAEATRRLFTPQLRRAFTLLEEGVLQVEGRGHRLLVHKARWLRAAEAEALIKTTEVVAESLVRAQGY